jgi:hypothetical protein
MFRFAFGLICLLSITLVLATDQVDAATCFTDPQGWTTQSGHPMNLNRYAYYNSVCREEASTRRQQKPWISEFVGCMKRHGYIPLYHDVFC